MFAAVFDFETGIKVLHKRKASPFDPRNKIYVSAYQLLDSEAKVELQYDRTGIKKVQIPWDKISLLIGQNIKFDLLWIWNDPDFQQWLKNGGRIYDTMVAEYLISAQQTTYASLNYLAQKYGGTLKNDEVKEFWDAGIDTPDIDPIILLPYAKDDILNTSLVYLEQQDELRRQGLDNLMRVYMDHLLAITEMEYNGMYFDVPKAHVLKEELQGKLAKIENDLQEIVDMVTTQANQPYFEFSATKPRDISAVLFNTPVKISEREEDGVYGPNAQKAGQIKYKWNIYVRFLDGFAVPTELSEKYKVGEVYKSEDKVLEAILTYAPKNPRPQLLESFVRLIQAHRALSKTLGTYLLGEGQKGEMTGFIPLVNAKDGCIHHGLDMVQTITGRLNGKNPNMQNVPKTFRDLFPSRYGEEGVIVEFDYSQLEICISAFLTQSDKLIADVQRGVDFHLKRAGYVAGIPYEEVLNNYKREPEVWKEKRQQAKAVSYAKAYGAHPEKIAADTGLALEDVELIFTREAEEYPEVGNYNKQIEEEVKKSRIPTAALLSIRDKETRTRTTVQGEHRGAGHFKSITGKRYCYYEYGVDSEKLRTSGRGIYRYFKTTELANYPVQGLGADIMSATVGKLFRNLLTLNLDGVTLINEVHDSVVFDCKNKETADKLVEFVLPILKDVDGVFKKEFGISFNVPIGVDVKISKTWGE